MKLYVYWRLPLAQLDAAAAAMQGFQHELASATQGLQARLLRRVDTDPVGEVGQLATLMETYARPGHGEGISSSLQGQIVQGGDTVSAPWRQGPRHVEVFVGIDAAR